MNVETNARKWVWVGTIGGFLLLAYYAVGLIAPLFRDAPPDVAAYCHSVSGRLSAPDPEEARHHEAIRNAISVEALSQYFTPEQLKARGMESTLLAISSRLNGEFVGMSMRLSQSRSLRGGDPAYGTLQVCEVRNHGGAPAAAVRLDLNTAARYALVSGSDKPIAEPTKAIPIGAIGPGEAKEVRIWYGGNALPVSGANAVHAFHSGGPGRTYQAKVVYGRKAQVLTALETQGRGAAIGAAVVAVLAAISLLLWLRVLPARRRRKKRDEAAPAGG